MTDANPSPALEAGQACPCCGNTLSDKWMFCAWCGEPTAPTLEEHKARMQTAALAPAPAAPVAEDIEGLAKRLEAMVGTGGSTISFERSSRSMCEDLRSAAATLRRLAREVDDLAEAAMRLTTASDKIVAEAEKARARALAAEAARDRMKEALEDLVVERGVIWRRDRTDAEEAAAWREHCAKMNAIARAALAGGKAEP